MPALALRAWVWVVYQPALVFYGDSFEYLQNMHQLAPAWHHPLGYAVFLRFMSITGSLAALTAVQHVIGIGIGVAIFALLARLGLPPIPAAIGALPTLFDAYQLNIEQFVMSDTVFTALAIAACTVVFWQRRPGIAAGVVAGLLVAAATLTRTVGLGIVVPLALSLLLLRTGGWRSAGALAVTALVPAALYMVWFHSLNGTYAFESTDGRGLYARVAPFADCAGLSLPVLERRLCETTPHSKRPSANFYAWDNRSPFHRLPGNDANRTRIVGDFARRVLLHQPGDYVLTVLDEFVHYFVPGRFTGPRDWPIQTWQFQQHTQPHVWRSTVAPIDFRCCSKLPLEKDIVTRDPSSGAASLFQYQQWGYTPGPALLVAVVLAVAGALVRGAPRERRAAALMFAASGIGMLLISSAASTFDYRYLLPALPLFAAGGVIGGFEVFRALRSWFPEAHLQARPQLAEPASGAK